MVITIITFNFQKSSKANKYTCWYKLWLPLFPQRYIVGLAEWIIDISISEITHIHTKRKKRKILTFNISQTRFIHLWAFSVMQMCRTVDNISLRIPRLDTNHSHGKRCKTSFLYKLNDLEDRMTILMWLSQTRNFVVFTHF